MPHEVETMFSAREVPWHGLGTIVATAPKSTEALQCAGLNWTVSQKPVCVDGRPVPPYCANVRQDTGEVLGIVTNRYRPVQNEEAFAWTDQLLATGEVRYETAGALRNGRTVWLLARLKEQRTILGDEIAPYLLFTNNHEGRGAVRVTLTPVRVVCWNTLNLALHRAAARVDRAWSVAHLGNLENHVMEARLALGLTRKYLDGLNTVAESLARKRLGRTWPTIVQKLLPEPPNASPKQMENVGRLRQDLLARIDAPDLKAFAGRGWAAVNAVADHVAHCPPLQPPTRTGAENRFARVALGHQLVDRAVSLILAA